METMKRVLDSDCKVHYSVYWPTDANSMMEAGPQPTMADLRLLESNSESQMQSMVQDVSRRPGDMPTNVGCQIPAPTHALQNLRSRTVCTLRTMVYSEVSHIGKPETKAFAFMI